MKETQPRDKTRPDSPSFRIPRKENNSKQITTRPVSAPSKRDKNNDDVGSRLHNKAQEIEMKKQKIRKSLKVDYSFRPTLAENTNRWLNRSSRENKNSREEIAVVSSASILNFTRSSLPNNIIVTIPDGPNSQKIRPIVLNRSEYKFSDADIKENYYN